jgi:3',5'-cyclic AMP phosphodiesterase CpdA
VREKLAALARFREEHGIDLVLCTGDYTVLGTDPELAAARAAIEPLTKAPLGFVTVPGNHDVYLPDSLGRFESHFQGLLDTDLGEHIADGVWPIVRLIGDSVAVVAVNSARPNPQIWRSNGRIPDAQLDALKRILADPRVADRFVFVLTHYAPRLANGHRDRFTHGLLNSEEFLGAVSGIERGAVLFGHVHRCYRVRIDGVSPLLVGAGSTTQDGREGLWVFDIDSTSATLTRGSWKGDRYVLEPSAERVQRTSGI